MRRLVESRFGRLPDDEVPGPTYLATKLEEFEQNEPLASPLDEVVSLEDTVDYDYTVGLDPAGAFKALRKKDQDHHAHHS